MYYRVAIQVTNNSCLKWKSSALTSLETLFQFFRFYKAIPQNRLWVFIASSSKDLNDMLARENDGSATNAVSATQFLSERGISSSVLRQEEVAVPTAILCGTRTGALIPLSQSSVQEPVLMKLSMSMLERRHFELEMQASGDYDQPYTFTLPVQVSQLLAWTRLMVRVQQGELQS